MKISAKLGSQPKIGTGRLSFLWLATLVFLVGMMAQGALAEDKSNTQNALSDEALHSELVKVALALDFYSEKCRGMSVDKYFNAVNRLYINKYSLSANNYIEQFFHTEVRDFKAQKQLELIQQLAQMKGCRGAKEQAWDKTTLKHYNQLLRQAEDSGWFPVVDHLAPADLE